MEYDDVIVGGGSRVRCSPHGCPRIRRDASWWSRRVRTTRHSSRLRPTFRTAGRCLCASTTGDDRRGSARPSHPLSRGRVIGGSSAVNATIALRGVPADYDEWAALGNDAWGWAEVLPHFRRLEDDPEGPDELHGRGGPIAIRRWRRDELIPTQRAFYEVCRRLGFEEVADHNHPHATGVGPFPQNRLDRLRLSTAIAYLLPARHRPNLAIKPHCLVNRVLFADDRAVGVEVHTYGDLQPVYGRRITLAAGAIGSPVILLRSGIGPRDALLDLGIEPVADLSGVGAGLVDHPVTRVLLVPKPGSCNRKTVSRSFRRQARRSNAARGRSEPARGRRFDHAEHPTGEHQPHLHHDR